MRSPPDREAQLRHAAWIALILAVAAFGAVVVRNVTDAMTGMVSNQPALADGEPPSR